MGKSIPKISAFDHVDQKTKERIIELFHAGYGPNSIAIALTIKHSLAERWLRANGLRRTRKEASAICFDRSKGALAIRKKLSQ